MRKNIFMRMFAFALSCSAGAMMMTTSAQAAQKTADTAQAAAIDGVVYGTVNLPYADFYYGELHQLAPTLTYTPGTLDLSTDKAGAEGLREEDQYDAVTSATTSKSKKFAATYFKDNDDGSVDIEGIKDAEIAIPENLYNEILSAKAAGKTCSNGIYDIISNMTVSDSAFTEYKVLNGDGTFSMMKTESAVDQDASAAITSNSTWGNYQIDFENIEVESGEMLGAVIEAKDSSGNTSYYGMKHESNLWLNTNEMSFAIKEFYVPQDKIHAVDYKLHEALEGQTITKITYMMKDSSDVVINTNLLVKKQLGDNASLSMSDVALSEEDMVSTLTPSNFPSDYDYTISSVTCNQTVLDASAYSFDANTKKLTLKSGKHLKAGSYVVVFTDDAYVDSNTSFCVTSDLTAEDISVQNNILTVKGGNESREDYLLAIASISINGTAYSVSGSTIFNTDGSINFDASINFHGNTTTYFPEGAAADYEIIISAAGYPDITARIGKSYVTMDTAELTAAIAKAEALKEADYTTASWTNLQTELAKAKDEAGAKHSQAAIDEAKEHLLAAIANLKKKEEATTGNTTLPGSSSNETTETPNTVPAAVVTLKKTTIKLSQITKKSMKVSWKNTANASGYEVQYSLKKNFKEAKTVTVSASKKETIFKKLTGKKKYYVRVRAFAASNPSNVYSSWSKAKTAKTR